MKQVFALGFLSAALAFWIRGVALPLSPAADALLKLALLTAALDGSLRNAKFRTDPYFGFAVPTQLPGVEPHLLYPHKTWQNKAEFDDTARKLVAQFQKNFVPFESHVDADVRAAAPEVRIAAE